MPWSTLPQEGEKQALLAAKRQDVQRGSLKGYAMAPSGSLPKCEGTIYIHNTLSQQAAREALRVARCHAIPLMYITDRIT